MPKILDYGGMAGLKFAARSPQKVREAEDELMRLVKHERGDFSSQPDREWPSAIVPTMSRCAKRGEFCQRLQDAGERVFKDYNPATPLHRADASAS